MWMEPNQIFESGLKVHEFEKNVLKAKFEGLEIGRTRFKPAPREPEKI